MKRKFQSIFLFIIILGLVSTGCSSNSKETVDTTAAASENIEISEAIDENGGTIKYNNNKVIVHVPNGAVEEEMNITVKKADIASVEYSESDFSSTGDLYEIHAEAKELKEEVQITLPYDSDRVLDPSKLVVLHFKEDGYFTEYGIVDEENHTVTIKVDNFSKFGIFEESEGHVVRPTKPITVNKTITFDETTDMFTSYDENNWFFNRDYWGIVDDPTASGKGKVAYCAAMHNEELSGERVGYKSRMKSALEFYFDNTQNRKKYFDDKLEISADIYISTYDEDFGYFNCDWIELQYRTSTDEFWKSVRMEGNKATTNAIRYSEGWHRYTFDVTDLQRYGKRILSDYENYPKIYFRFLFKSDGDGQPTIVNDVICGAYIDDIYVKRIPVQSSSVEEDNEEDNDQQQEEQQQQEQEEQEQKQENKEDEQQEQNANGEEANQQQKQSSNNDTEEEESGTLHLITPNANTVWTQGDEEVIRWEAIGKKGDLVNVLLTTEESYSPTNYRFDVIGESVSNTGEYHWTPSSRYKGRYIIRVEDVSDYKNIYDVSEPFEIVAPTLSSPANVSAEIISDTSVMLTWEGVDDAEEYIVQRSKGNGMFEEIAVLDKDSSQYTDNNLTAGASYSYRVKAKNELSDSEYSNKAQVDIALQAPLTAHNNVLGNLVVGAGKMFKHGEYIYYIQSNNLNRFRIDNPAKQEKELFFFNSYRPQVVGDYVYSQNRCVIKQKIDGSEYEKLENIGGGAMCIYDGWIYYINGGYIHKVKLDGTGDTKIGSDKAEELVVQDGWIYYVNDEYGETYLKLFKMKTDGSSVTQITDNQIPGSQFVIDGQSIYYLDHSSRIHSISIDGTNSREYEAKCYAFNVADGWIYYSPSKGGLYKLKSDESVEFKIDDNKYNYILIVDKWIYHDDYYSDNYFISTDGKEKYIVE